MALLREPKHRAERAANRHSTFAANTSGAADAPIVLYNLKSDIGEKNDVAAAHPEIAAKIGDWLKTARSDSPDWIPTWSK